MKLVTKANVVAAVSTPIALSLLLLLLLLSLSSFNNKSLLFGKTTSLPSSSSFDYSANIIDRSLLHQCNGNPRGRKLEDGTASDTFDIRHWSRDWRQFYLETTDRPRRVDYCNCQVGCASSGSSSSSDVYLYMTTDEGYWMHDDWPGWTEEGSLNCVADTAGTTNQTCRINAFLETKWYCYIALHAPEGEARDCTVLCDFS